MQAENPDDEDKPSQYSALGPTRKEKDLFEDVKEWVSKNWLVNLFENSNNDAKPDDAVVDIDTNAKLKEVISENISSCLEQGKKDELKKELDAITAEIFNNIDVLISREDFKGATSEEKIKLIEKEIENTIKGDNIVSLINDIDTKLQKDSQEVKLSSENTVNNCKNQNSAISIESRREGIQAPTQSVQQRASKETVLP